MLSDNLAWLSRTTLLIGEENLTKLNKAHVLIVGLGGVGSYAAEAIARAGVGKITIIDGDVVEASNRNRQLPALSTTHGHAKADIMKERMLAINPDAHITALKEFMQPNSLKVFLSENLFDYAIDAIDSLTPKLTLIKAAHETKTPLVSAMGAGGKFDPAQIKIAPIFDTHTCDLAFYVRKRLKKMNLQGKVKIKTVFSEEPANRNSLMYTDGQNFKKSAFGTISYMPAMFGLTCASVAIRDIMNNKPLLKN